METGKKPNPEALEQGKRLEKLIAKLGFEKDAEFCRHIGFLTGGTINHIKSGRDRIYISNGNQLNKYKCIIRVSKIRINI